MAADVKRIRVKQNFSKLGVEGLVFDNLSSAPSSPVEGQVYYDTDDNAALIYTGAAFVPLGGGLESVVAGSSKIDVDNTDPLNPEIDVVVSNLIDDASTTSSNIWSASKVNTTVNNAIATAAGGFDNKDGARIASAAGVANLSLITVADFDGAGQGITLVEGDRVFVNHASSADGIEATSGKRKGLYIVGTVTTGTAALTRTADANTSAEVTNGMHIVNVAEGTYAGYAFTLVTADPITLDTTVLTFADIPNAGYTAGAGLGLTTNSFSVNVDDSSIEINSDTLRVKAGGVTNTMLAGSIADSKLSTITTANKVSGSAVQLKSGSALADSTGLDVTVDNSSIENNSGTLRVKAGGITNTMLAGSIADSKLSTITTANKVSGSAVQLATTSGIEDSTGLRVKVDATGGSNVAEVINLSSNGIAVKIDDATLDVNGSSQLIVKSGGIGLTQLATAVKPYWADFADTDFSSGDLAIAAGTHGLGATKNLFVQVFETGTPNVCVTDGVEITVASSGDVTVSLAAGVTAFDGYVRIAY